MIKWIIFPMILCLAEATTKQDAKAKTTSSPNAIQPSPKYEMIYQPMKYQQIQLVQQPRTQYVPVQIVAKPYYLSQNQPHAMIIIAQPALVPQSLLYQNPTQQLLNYFQNNPQAKYQLLQGNYQQAQPQPTYVQPVLTTPTNYLYTNQPQESSTQYNQPTTQLTHQLRPQHNHPTTQPAQYQPVQQQYQQLSQPVQQQYQQLSQPLQQQYQHLSQPVQKQYQPAQQEHQLGNIAHLAQLAAQQYVSTQTKTPSAIVTGFEQFSPEQQAQIRAQLNSHLGSNYHAIQTPNKFGAEQESFVPTPQIKQESVSTVSSQSQDASQFRFSTKTKM